MPKPYWGDSHNNKDLDNPFLAKTLKTGARRRLGTPQQLSSRKGYLATIASSEENHFVACYSNNEKAIRTLHAWRQGSRQRFRHGEQGRVKDNRACGHHGGQGNQTTAEEERERTNLLHSTRNPGNAPELI